MALFLSVLCLNAQTVKTVGTGANYTTLKAAFDAINAGTISGAITLQITSSTTETASAVLNASGTGSANYSSVKIYPTTAGYTISGAIAGALISLNGADSVSIDGRVNATGSTSALTITNTNTGTSASTILFTNAAENNAVKYCTIKGSSTATTGGIFSFTTATSGNGNSGNLIDNNSITNGGGRVANVVYSVGSVGYENKNNIVSNNLIYDFFRTGTAYCFQLGAASTDWTISNNSMWETTSITSASTLYGIYINNTSGNNFLISGNYFGGKAAQCGGAAMSVSSTGNSMSVTGFYLVVGTTTATSVQGNTIANIATGTSGAAPFVGIYSSAGNLNIGTVTGNTIGSTTATGSITGSCVANNGYVYGMNLSGSGTVDVENNMIGGISGTNTASDQPTHVIAINRSSTGNATISFNTIGSTTIANSIQSIAPASQAAQNVYGINNSSTGIITINNNTIANLRNGTTSTSAAACTCIGINCSAGTNTINNNTIYSLVNNGASTSATNTAAVVGIALSGTTQRTVNGNTIYNLSSSYSSFAGSIIGIYFSAGTSPANTCAGNYIYGSAPVGASSTGGSLYGIKIAAGATSYYNNMISFGGTTRTTLYGIYETGAANNNNNIFFNSIYMGGSLVSGATNKSYCLYSAVTTNTRDIRNNIFMNARSTVSGSNLHYPIYIVTTGGTLTCDYNDYFVTGTGGTLGYYGANKTALPIVTSQDANSFNLDPKFNDPTNAVPNLHVLDGTPCDGMGTAISAVTTDFDNQVRDDFTPTDIGADAGNHAGPSAPTGNASQSFCSSSAPTVANLVAEGTNVQWYAAAFGGTALASTVALTNGTHYYASQTVSGIESAFRLNVTATLSNPAAPTGSANQAFCYSGTIANLTATGSNINWYNATSAGTLYNSTDALVNGTTYYASQTVNACEGTGRLAVIATITNPSAPTGNSTQTFCNSATIANLTALGTAIKWYDDPTAGNLLTASTALTQGSTYYASQTVSTCESQNRLAVNVSINVTDAPTGDISQTFCNAATIANLTINGTSVKWYLAANGGSSLSSSTALVNGTTYYASQTLNSCESAIRLGVTAQVNVTAAPTGNNSQSFCNSATIADLVVTGTSLQWYDAATNGNILPSSTNLVDGVTYYASQTLNSCESASRLAVTAHINTTAAPTGNNSQSFCNAATIADIVVTGTSLQWYDAATNGNILISTTNMVDGVMYYATQTLNSCESTGRLAVTSHINTTPAPTGNASQTFASAPTLADLVVTGTGIIWYDAASAGNVLSSTSATVDGTTYYASQTLNGCESQTRLAVTVHVAAAEITINLHLFLEGIFDPNTSLMNPVINGETGFPQFGDLIADNIQVDLCSANAPYANVGISLANVSLATNGLATFKVPASYNQSYYIRITNRNHLETWSAIPVSFSSSTVDYNFSTSLLQAYGTSPQVLLAMSPDIYGFFLGDLNQSGYIDLDDFVMFEPDLTLGSTGFLITDFNGGGYVDLDDFVLFEPRLTLGNASEYPAKKK